MPILFSLDLTEKHNVMFKFDNKQMRWYVEFEKAEQKVKKGKENGGEK